MIKRTLIFTECVTLNVHNYRLVIKSMDNDTSDRKIPLEDIDTIIVEHQNSLISNSVFTELLQYNATIITCNQKHMPNGMFLNLDGNTLQSIKFKNQIHLTNEMKGEFWRQTISRKIYNQAMLLKKLNFEIDNMLYWSKNVSVFDVENYEGRASVYYWSKLFLNWIPNFTRDRFGKPPNNLLNYGYTILRSICAKNLIGSGLLPTLGIFHKNKYNAHCLADDIMEPYRPYIDNEILEILTDGLDITELNNEFKIKILSIYTKNININKMSLPLMDAMHLTTSSLSGCIDNKLKTIKYPIL